MKRRHWTKDELTFLEDNWGVVTVPHIAKKLERTIESVKLKAYRIGLGDPRFSSTDITLHQFTKISGIPYRTINQWCNDGVFPVSYKRYYKQRIKMVNIEKFWEWAGSHKEMLDLTRFEKGDLGIEPKWAEEKRKDDYITKQYRRKSHNDAWTASEDNQLRFLVSKHKYTYPELANLLGRSEGAIKRRFRDLNIKYRPARLDNRIKYTESEVNLIIEGVTKGRSIESIAYEIGKSSMGVRGKLERMGYKFNKGVPYLPVKVC